MRRRFGAWMHRPRRVLAAVIVVTVVAVLLLLIARADVVQGIGITYWQHQAQPCGKVYYDAGDWSLGASDSQAATTCFLQAYTQCHAASLIESVGQVAPSEYTYLIEPALLALGGHTCSIQVSHGYGVAPASPPVWVACADVAQRWYGLHFFACGTYGDRFVGMAPPSQSPPGVACGDIQVPLRVVQPSVVDASARAVVTCFVRARQTCQPAWAQATVTDVAEHVDRQLLLVEPSHQTCVVLELEWLGSQYGSQIIPLHHGSYFPPSICTKLVLTENGLYVDSCERRGGLGPIVLPICEGHLPIAMNAPCTPVPPAKN
jgi:hypothetical protein